jgi:hypothetical protein
LIRQRRETGWTKFLVTAQVPARSGRLPEKSWWPAPFGT